MVIKGLSINDVINALGGGGKYLWQQYLEQYLSTKKYDDGPPPHHHRGFKNRPELRDVI